MGDGALSGESAAWDLGQTIGAYRLVKRLGHGGMGSVWLAEQTQPVRRKVALKLIKPSMDTEEVVARFSSERQALAMIEHPAIARVYDAGSTPKAVGTSRWSMSKAYRSQITARRTASPPQLSGRD